jgi:phosphatidylglycerol:prolipoprotein diacylglycerol transferase
MHETLVGPIKSYGLMLALSFLLGMVISVRRGKRRGLRPEDIYDLVFLILVTSLVGVRLAFVLTHLDQFPPWTRALAIWDGGLTLYGGLLLAIPATWWFCRRRRLDFLVIADALAPPVALGIGITRIGCFLAGCCYGKPCSLPWGVHFPASAPATKQFGPVAVQPSQLYASAAGFLVFALLLLWERWSPRRGATFWRFLMLYGLDRFLNDFTRYYEPSQRTWLGWSNNQWLSLVVAVGALVMLLRLRPARP